jgi:hypothetical protein
MRRFRAGAALALVVVCSLLTSAPAAADDGPVAAEPLSAPLIEEWGRPAGHNPPDDCVRVVNDLAITCFQKYGDVIWVYDPYDDLWLAQAHWSLWLRDGQGEWTFHKWGRCKASPASVRVWVVCDRDFYEDSTYPNAKGGQGAGIRLYAVDDDWSGYRWIRNNA